MEALFGASMASAPTVSGVLGVIWGSSSGTGSCFGVAGGGDFSLSSSMGSGDWGLGKTESNSKVGVSLTSSLRMGLEELLGQVKAKGVARAGVL